MVQEERKMVCRICKSVVICVWLVMWDIIRTIVSWIVCCYNMLRELEM